MPMSSWDEKPKPAWVEPPDPARVGHARKNRRRWCRGRVGREHTPGEIEMSPDGERWLRNTGYDVACFRPEWYRKFWICQHLIRCTTCGKILDRSLGARCPIYSPEVTRWKAVEMKRIRQRTDT